MAITHCNRCGRIYNRVRRDICETCIVEENRAFAVVRGYLHDHPDTTMEELVSATDIPEALVVSMIRDGRLILRDGPNLTYACAQCGRPTQVGRFCVSCTRELSAGRRVVNGKKLESERTVNK